MYLISVLTVEIEPRMLYKIQTQVLKPSGIGYIYIIKPISIDKLARILLFHDNRFSDMNRPDYLIQHKLNEVSVLALQ